MSRSLRKFVGEFEKFCFWAQFFMRQGFEPVFDDLSRSLRKFVGEFEKKFFALKYTPCLRKNPKNTILFL